MARLTPVIDWQVTAAQPIVVGDTRVTLQSRTLVVGWSLTRLIELGLLGLGLVTLIVMASIRRKEHVS